MAQIPEFTPVEKLNPEAAKAAYEMILEALRHGSEVFMVHLADVTYGDTPIGDWEISVRRTNG